MEKFQLTMFSRTLKTSQFKIEQMNKKKKLKN